MSADLLLFVSLAPVLLLVVSFAVLRRRWQRARAAEGGVVRRPAELAAEGSAEGQWWFGMLAPLLLIGGVALWLRRHWALLPERLPVHWGASGQADAWTTRSGAHVFGLLLEYAALVLVLAALAVLMERSSSRFAGRSRLVQAMRRIVTLCAWFVACTGCLTSLLPIAQDPSRMVRLIGGGSTVFSLGLAVYTVVTVFRVEDAVVAGQNSTDARFWKAGLFYVNPGDSALMVPKRNGIGYTLNFGRPVCWLLLALLVVVALVPLFLRR